MSCPNCKEPENICVLSFIEGIYYEYQCQKCGHVWYKGKDPFKKKGEENQNQVKSVDELFMDHLEMMAFTYAMPVLAYLLKYSKMEIETLSELIFPLSEADVIERLEFLKPFKIVDFNKTEAWIKRVE